MKPKVHSPDSLPPVRPDMPPEPKKKPFQRLKTWIGAHKKTSVAIAAGLIILIGGGVTLIALNSQPEPEPQPPVAKEPEPQPEPTYYSPLTGIEVKNEAATKQPVTAIMLENSPEARPQSGLKNSGVVFEAIAEGGITRFLALYQQEKPKLIGPVRSLRPYYVDWLAPFNASVVHVGGSKAALDEIRNGKYRDIDQFFNASAYWRASDRYAPHNVYTSFERIDALNKQKGYKESVFEGLPRKDDSASDKPNATKIDIKMSSPTYNSSYRYHKKSNSYLRSQAGSPHNDREDGQINPKVVVAMLAPMTHVMEDGYRESIKTTGSGTAYVFQDGKATKGRWKKTSRSNQISFVDSSGNEIDLNRGQTWISVIPESSGGVTWQ